LDNYRRLLSDSDLDVSFRNSVFVTVASVVLTLILASLASFAIARMITVSGKVLAVLFGLGLAIPAQINLVPIYYIFKDLGLTNSFIGLIIINVTTTLPISIFILSAFFKQVSKEMYEASEVDGASPLRIYRSIALPLSRPAMGATAIFLFVINWNDLLWPLLLIQQSEKKTLPLATSSFWACCRLSTCFFGSHGSGCFNYRCGHGSRGSFGFLRCYCAQYASHCRNGCQHHTE